MYIFKSCENRLQEPHRFHRDHQRTRILEVVEACIIDLKLVNIHLYDESALQGDLTL